MNFLLSRPETCALIKQAYPDCFTDDLKLIESNVEEDSIIAKFIKLSYYKTFVDKGIMAYEETFLKFLFNVAAIIEKYFNKEIKRSYIDKLLNEIIQVLENPLENLKSKFKFEKWLSEEWWSLTDSMSIEIDRNLRNHPNNIFFLTQSLNFYQELKKLQSICIDEAEYEYVRSNSNDKFPEFVFTNMTALLIKSINSFLANKLEYYERKNRQKNRQKQWIK